MQLLQQTLFDAVVTAPMEAYWTALMLNTSGLILTHMHTHFNVLSIKMWTFHMIVHFILTIFTLSLSTHLSVLLSLPPSLYISQYGGRGRNRILGDPFRPDEIPAVHWY